MREVMLREVMMREMVRISGRVRSKMNCVTFTKTQLPAGCLRVALEGLYTGGTHVLARLHHERTAQEEPEVCRGGRDGDWWGALAPSLQTS